MRLSIPFRMLAAGVVAGGLFAAAVAQPPAPPEGHDGPPPEHRDHLRGVLDTNHDHELDSEEIKNASAALAHLDKNGDGRIDHEEFRPPLPPIPRGEGGFRGPPPGEHGPEGRPPRGDRFEAGPPPGRGPREGGPRERALRGEGGPGPGPGPGGPSPERLVERAMGFDADGDGKLDRAELETFAGEFVQRMRNAMADRGGEGARRRPGGPGDGERPERPRRPAD
jgi:hypothetical protein